MFLKRGIIIIFTNLLCLATYAQQVYFNSRYDFNQSIYDYGLSILDVDSGYYVMVSSPNQSGLSNLGGVLFYIDSIGIKRRQDVIYKYHINYYWGGPGTLTMLNGGSIILAGSYVDSANGTDAMLMKFNSYGDTIWSRPYGDTLFQSGWKVKRTRDDGFIICGQTGNYDLNGDVLLFKTDSAGNIQWQKHYGGNNYDIGVSLDTCFDGGFIISGATKSFGANAGSQCLNAYIIKTDSMGNLQWYRAPGGQYSDTGWHIFESKDSGYVMGGVLTAFDPSASSTCDESMGRPWITKLDSLGNTIWSRTYGDSIYNTALFMIRELADGSIIGAGQVARDSVGYSQGLILKVSSAGDSLWYMRYENLSGYYSDNKLRDIQPTADGGFIACGYVSPALPDTGTQDVWILKIDSNGCEVANCLINLTQNQNLIDKENIFAYPNPTTGIFTVRFNSHSSSDYVMDLMDVSGRKLIQEKGKAKAGTNEHKFDINSFSKGVYFVRFTSYDLHQMTRVILE